MAITTARAKTIQDILDSENIDVKVTPNEVATDPKGRVEPKDNVDIVHDEGEKKIVVTIFYGRDKVATKVSSTGKCLLVATKSTKGDTLGPLAPDVNVLAKYPLK